MLCIACHGVLADGDPQCSNCGQDQRMRCSTCGSPAAAAHRFCALCGARLSFQLQGQSAAELNDAAEKRHLTVLFCDLVDSTALSGVVDAEDLREIIQAYQAIAADIIRQYDGYIAQYLGDGLLVYFGYPRAHEDSPMRALRAAEGIISALPRLGARLRHITTLDLQVRIGIHTGMVVVGQVGAGARHERLAIGETPNIAARLQTVAQGNEVVVSGATRHAIRDALPWQPLGALSLRGVAHPVEAWRLSRSGEPAALVGPDHARRQIGRDDELQQLEQDWQHALAGQPRVVLIEGEPGIGKSHLLAQLRQKARGDGALSLVLRCSPYHAASEWFPVIEGMERLARFEPQDDPHERYRKLLKCLPPGMADQEQDLQLLARLLRAAPQGPAVPLTLAPALAKKRTEAAVLRWLNLVVQKHPLMLAIEDLHWADPSTLALAVSLAEQMGAQRLLLVLTQRAGDSARWAPTVSTRHLVLDRLPSEAAEALLLHCMGGKRLPAVVVRRIIENTDGVPLFIEEFTRTVLESDVLQETPGGFELRVALPVALIPDNLRDSLAARLDRLDAGRAVARRASVIGRRFQRGLLAALCGADESLVQQGLQELLAAGLVFALEGSDQDFEFKHALVQAAAYDSMLRRDRLMLHGLLAGELLRRDPGLMQRQPELLAHHHSEAHQWSKAVQLWLRAGQMALARSANHEAVLHLRAGLALVSHLPPEEGAQLELSLLSTLAPAIKVTRGFTAPELETLYARVEALCQVMPDRPEIFVALNGVWGYRQVKGQQAGLVQLAEQNLAFVQRAGAPTMLAQATFSVGVSLLWTGDFRRANETFLRAVEVYDPVRDAETCRIYGSDPRVAAECYRSYALWALGLTEQAQAAIERAGRWSSALNHPFSQAWSLAFRSAYNVMVHEPGRLLEEIDQHIAYCREVGHVFWLATTTASRGWALAMIGRLPEGIEALRAALAFQGSIGVGVIQPQWRCKLAEALMLNGQYQDASDEIEASLQACEANEDFFCRIEILRVRGEIELRRHPQEPELGLGHLRAGLELALRLRQLPWGLRIATQLWRAAQAGGPPAPWLPELLAQVTEGHDTWVVREARAALQASACPVSTDPAL